MPEIKLKETLMTHPAAHSRRTVLGWGAAGLATGLLSGRAAAQAAGPVELAKLVLGSPPGGVLDAFARKLAEAIQPSYARSVIVENKTGASGQIAVSTVKAAASDGATILVTPMPMMGIYPHTYKRLPYNPMTDFVPVSMGAVFDLTLAVGQAVPAEVKTLKDFFAWCKTNPSKAYFGSPAAGSTPHFMGSMAARSAGVQFTHIAYRGPTPAISDMVGGQVAAACSTVGDFLPFIESGKARLLATTGANRNRFVPQVPTFAEQGFRDIVLDDWFGLFLPAGTPQLYVRRLSDALKTALGAPAFALAMETKGIQPKWSSPEDFAARLQADTRKWGPIVKSFNFTAES